MPVYIAGIGLEAVKEHWDLSILDLATSAGQKALEDANINQVDYVLVANMTTEFSNRYANLSSAIADQLDLVKVPRYRIEAACGTGGSAVNLAYEIAKSEQKNVLVIGVEKLSDFLTPSNTSSMMLAEDWSTGLVAGGTFVTLNALALRYYLEKFNADHDYIMMLPVICHEHAVNNPYAQFRNKITLEKVKESPVIADPLHLFESSAYGDGAAAVVVSSNKGDVEIIASAVSTDLHKIATREDPLTFSAVKKAAKEAYEEAKVDFSDIDVLEIHDAFSITGVIALEDLGFAKKGEGWKMITHDNLSINGKIPTNTFGGLKARGHPVGATGVYQIAEIVLQLRGMAGKNQVESAKIGLAENIGAIATTAAIHIMRKKE